VAVTTVYVLWDFDMVYGGRTLVGVFSSRNNAEIYKEKIYEEIYPTLIETTRWKIFYQIEELTVDPTLRTKRL
jgi:hypothetical protein